MSIQLDTTLGKSPVDTEESKIDRQLQFWRDMQRCDQTMLADMESGCVRMEYYSRGVGASLKEYKRFKKMAADLVTEKEEETSRNLLILGDENDINEEDNVEIVTGSFLEEITGEFSMYGTAGGEGNAIHAMTVGEILDKLEV